MLSLKVKFANDVENSESCIYIVVAKSAFRGTELLHTRRGKK